VAVGLAWLRSGYIQPAAEGATPLEVIVVFVQFVIVGEEGLRRIYWR